MKKWMFTAAVILLAAVFAVSAFLLIRYYVQIHQAQSAFDRLTQVKEQAQLSREEDSSSLVEVTDPETGETRLVLPEYAPIYQLNPDTVGWISIEGTNIDFPVLHKPEVTNYYLNRDFYGKWSNQGAIYVREECDVFAPSDNITIYGHRTSAGTMFGALQKYKSKDFYLEHPCIRFDSLTEHRTYQILSVFTINATIDSDFPYHLFVDAEDDAEFDQYFTKCKLYSLYETGVSASPGDKLITLSTCNGSTNVGRLVVVAKQIQE